MAADKPGKCASCKFYVAITQLEDEWRGGWLQIGTCGNTRIHAGVVVPEHGCGAWEMHPSATLEER